MRPIDVLRLWFDAHAEGDLDAARELVVDDIEIVVPGARLVGFDSFMQWYRERVLKEGPSFKYTVEDVLGGDTHAAAVLSLSVDGRSWRQVALFSLQGERISSIWAVEEMP